MSTVDHYRDCNSPAAATINAGDITPPRSLEHPSVDSPLSFGTSSPLPYSLSVRITFIVNDTCQNLIVLILF